MGLLIEDNTYRFKKLGQRQLLSTLNETWAVPYRIVISYIMIYHHDKNLPYRDIDDVTVR